MDGYELAALLRSKVTITTAMQAADKLVELEDKLKQKTGKKNESKSSGNKNKVSVSEQREAIDSDGSATDSSRLESKPDFYEPLLSDESKMAD